MRLDSVGKRYGVRQPWVVRGMSADVPAGRLIRVEGRNVVFGVLTAEPASGLASPAGSLADKVTDAGHHPGIVVAGLLIALICLLVGSAVGALCNPPMLRHPRAAMLATLAAVVLALAVDVSPAAAAISGTKAQAASPLAATWPGAASLIGACCLLAAAWGVSVFAATRRDSWSVHSE